MAQRSGVDLDADDENAAFVVLSGDEECFTGFGVDFEQREEVFSAGFLNARADDVTLRFALFLGLDDVFQSDLQNSAVRKLGGRSFGFGRTSCGAFEQFVAVVSGKRGLSELGHFADLWVDAGAVIRSMKNDELGGDGSVGFGSFGWGGAFSARDGDRGNRGD